MDEIKKSIYETLREGYTEDLWYDWFCKDKSLEKRGINLLNKLKRISLSKKIDINKNYVFFKNSCPVVGHLYDELKICDMETHDVLFVVVPKSGFKKDNEASQVWDIKDGTEKLAVSGTWKDVLKYFNGDEE